MIFANPVFIQVGAAMTALVCVSLFVHAYRRRKLADYLGGRRAADRLSRTALYRPRLERVGLLAVAALGTSLALAEPRWPPPPLNPPPPVRSVVIALDISGSMQATDVAPTRLARAVEVANGLVTTLQGERVGLLLFAGGTYALAPPTFDHQAVRFLLEGVTPTIASHVDPGTMFSVGIAEATRMVTQHWEEDGEGSIVLIGDGDRGESEAVVQAAASAAAARGITVHTIGVGTSRGGTMSMPLGYRFEPIVHDNGARAVSALDESLLRRIAEAGGGRYYPAGALRLDDVFRRVAPAPLEGPRWWTRTDPVALLAAAALLGLLFDSLLGVRMPSSIPRSFRRLA